MHKFKNHKTPAIRFLKPAIKTKQHLLLRCCIYSRRDFIIKNLINQKKHKQQNKIQKQKLFKNNTHAGKNLQRNVISRKSGKGS